LLHRQCDQGAYQVIRFTEKMKSGLAVQQIEKMVGDL